MPPSPRPPASPNRLDRAPRAAAARGWFEPFPRLYAIVDVDVCATAGHPPLDVVRAFLAAGVRLIQLRAKTWESGAFLDLAAAAVAEAQAAGAVMVVNDRADIAVLSHAPGLHVGQDDLSPVDARRLLGPDAWLGLSTHTVEQWTAALATPISYVAIGPVFDTGTKATGFEAVGLHTVRLVATAAAARALPVVAIGGITLERAPEVIEAGAAAVAVISGLLAGPPEARARAFIRALA
ncbi:MAG: thiamine phosphate synthase [Acidobacteriota bacterium]|nr:thiamine phosphate synthase [Acidobacteriota bacterium]